MFIMRRSKMVELMAEALLVRYGGDEQERNEVRESSFMMRTINANIALEACEKAGMFPPETRESQWVWEPENYEIVNGLKHIIPDNDDDLMHKLEMEHRYIDCPCTICKPSQAL